MRDTTIIQFPRASHPVFDVGDLFTSNRNNRILPRTRFIICNMSRNLPSMIISIHVGPDSYFLHVVDVF